MGLGGIVSHSGGVLLLSIGMREMDGVHGRAAIYPFRFVFSHLGFGYFTNFSIHA